MHNSSLNILKTFILSSIIWPHSIKPFEIETTQSDDSEDAKELIRNQEVHKHCFSLQ